MADILRLESKSDHKGKGCYSILLYYDHLESIAKTSGYSVSYFTPVGYLVPEYTTCFRSYQPS